MPLIKIELKVFKVSCFSEISSDFSRYPPHVGTALQMIAATGKGPGRLGYRRDTLGKPQVGLEPGPSLGSPIRPTQMGFILQAGLKCDRFS